MSIDSNNYYSFGNKKYKIRKKNYKGSNGKIYPKYVVTLPVGINIKDNKLKYHEYSCPSVEGLVSLIEYEKGNGYIETKLIPSQITVKELCEKWFEVIKPSLAEYTKISYRSILNNRIYPYIGENKAKESLDYDSIQKLINELWARKYKEKSLINTKIVLSGVIDYAIQNRIIFNNPTKNIKIPRTQAHSYNILSKEKMIELLKIAPKYENGNAFVICMLGALRLGECWGLSITDVDINNCSIFIHQQLQKGKIVNRTKNGLSRRIVLPKAAMPFMKAEQDKRIKNQQKAGNTWENKNNLFFTGSKGKPVNMSKLYKEFKLMMQELGVDNIRIHDLRHSMATAIVNATGDIYEAQRYLGHMHINTTKLYLHSTVESQARLQEVLNAIF